MLRLVGVLGTIVAFVAAESAPAARAAEARPLIVRATDARLSVLAGNPQGTHQPSVFVTLPITKGFADATHALVETRQVVEDALYALNTIRLNERVEDSDAVLTVLGRGAGHAELSAALQLVDPTVVASPVMISGNEGYIEAMLTVGSCGEAATSVSTRSTSPSCYRKVFVGLCATNRAARQGQSAASNSWNVCANALARDVQAWVSQNASRLLVLPR
jgi:hypothetical protein